MPTYSVADVLSGAVAGDALKDKAVVVGAYATELKDLFAVPVYGILSGPMLHVRATETLVQDLRRYFPGRILLLNDQLAARRVSGSFSSKDPQAVLDSLQAALGFEQHQVLGRFIVLR